MSVTQGHSNTFNPAGMKYMEIVKLVGVIGSLEGWTPMVLYNLPKTVL